MKKENITNFEQSILRIFVISGKGVLNARQVGARLSLNDKNSRAKIAKILLKLAQENQLTQVETGKFSLNRRSFDSNPTLIDDLNEITMQNILKQFEFSSKFNEDVLVEMEKIIEDSSKKEHIII